MGALPRPVYFLHLVLRSVPSLTGLAIGMYVARWLAGWGEVTILIVLPIVLGFGMVAIYVLRPLRQRILLLSYEAMLSSGIRMLMDLGLWELLRVAYRFWPGSPVIDHVGISTLHRVYDHSDDRRKEIIVAGLRKLEAYPNCPVATEANEFLGEIEAADRIA